LLALKTGRRGRKEGFCDSNSDPLPGNIFEKNYLSGQKFAVEKQRRLILPNSSDTKKVIIYSDRINSFS
jgi:hypothetical protein